MNLTQLRVFDTVMRTGSVTSAARRLHVTQPAVTNHLKALEDYYDVVLFRREGRSLRATALGHELAEISGRLFALDEDAASLLEATKALTRGTVRIASDGPYLLVPIVKAFRERFPGVRVGLQIANTDDVQSMLLSERCDVTVQAHREDDPRVFAMPLAVFELIMFVNLEHPWALEARTSVAIDELRDRGMIVRDPGSTTRRVLDQACEEAGFSPDYVIETTSRETVKEAVAAGLGIGVVAGYELRDDPRFWPLHVTGADMSFTEEVLCPNRRRNMRVVRELLKVTEEVVAQGGIPTTSGRRRHAGGGHARR
jgi:aminoethylphosphonate catabolism LysR family transcriptional regulator